jgi:hypothetical protein
MKLIVLILALLTGQLGAANLEPLKLPTYKPYPKYKPYKPVREEYPKYTPYKPVVPVKREMPIKEIEEARKEEIKKPRPLKLPGFVIVPDKAFKKRPMKQMMALMFDAAFAYAAFQMVSDVTEREPSNAEPNVTIECR